MAPLPPRRVIAVVMHNKAPDTVVLRLNSAHRPKATPVPRYPKAAEPCAAALPRSTPSYAGVLSISRNSCKASAETV
jgi:hypothetical protein